MSTENEKGVVRGTVWKLAQFGRGILYDGEPFDVGDNVLVVPDTGAELQADIEVVMDSPLWECRGCGKPTLGDPASVYTIPDEGIAWSCWRCAHAELQAETLMGLHRPDTGDTVCVSRELFEAWHRDIDEVARGRAYPDTALATSREMRQALSQSEGGDRG